MQQYEDDLKKGKKRQVLRKAEVDLIGRAKDILIENLQNPPTITELARQTGLNEQKLKKGFNLLFDTTINKYLLNERMEHAKVLLAEGSKSIKEIAAFVGFSNHGYFAGKFKEKFGLLPSDYVKAIKQEKIPRKIEKAVA
jgi:AraC-like DNA-binding protein